MAKKYIWENETFTFTERPSLDGKLITADIDDSRQFEFTGSNDLAGYTLDVDDERFIFAGKDAGLYFTRDGILPDEDSRENHVVIIAGEVLKSKMIALDYDAAEPGDHVVSLYLDDGSSSGIGLPNKNVEYTLHAHNHLERIRYKLQKKAEQGDSESSGGGNTMVAHIHLNADEHLVLDRTYKEIKDALDSDCVVVGRELDDDGCTEYSFEYCHRTEETCTVIFYNYDQDGLGLTFTSNSETGQLIVEGGGPM